VTVSEKTRKIIWVEAGGRCAVCRRQVLTEGTETDDPSIFGEEAHIIARSQGGPRAGGLPEDQLDSHENLILLCREHHKQVDDQPNHFTVERLRQIKQAHKEWVASLGTDGPRAMRLVPDPSFPESELLKLIFTGSALWAMLRQAYELKYALPDRMGEEDESLVVEFIDLVRDYMDIAGDFHSARDHRDAEKALGSYISRLGERGLFVGATTRRMLLTGGVSKEPLSWPVVTIEIQPVAVAQVVDRDGEPWQPAPEDVAALDQFVAEEEAARRGPVQSRAPGGS
jgi:hypothetical protein